MFFRRPVKSSLSSDKAIIVDCIHAQFQILRLSLPKNLRIDAVKSILTLLL